MFAKLDSLTVDSHTPTPEHDSIRFKQGDTGEVILETPAEWFYRLRRSRLRSMLKEGLDVRYRKRLVEISYSGQDVGQVTALFEDGSEVTGRILIGADGSNSAVRQHLLGVERAQQDRVPYVSSFVQARYTREQALFLRSFHPLYLGAIHPLGRFGFMGMQEVLDPEKPETWTFFFNNTWRLSLAEQEAQKDWTPKQRVEQMQETGKDFCEPWRSGLAWLDPVEAGKHVWHFGMGIWDPRTPEHQWDNNAGRVTLCGDSAHTMTVQRAQGLNHALRSARELCGAIRVYWNGEKSQAAAMTDYEEVMKARAGEEVALTKSTTETLHDWRKVLDGPLAKRGVR